MKKILLLLTLLISTVSFANTDRYRLMFNTDPSTEITVGWEQVSGNSPVVYYGTTDYGTAWASYPNNNGVDRQVTYQGMDNRFSRLTGLQPNTVYYFVIKDSQGTSQRYWFRTCPDVNTETLSFISGGDSRSGATQRRNSNRMVAKIRPHAVLFGGDLQNTPSNAVMQEWLDDWQLTITSDNQMIPVVHSYGNHEEYGNGGPNLIRDLFDTNYDVYYNLRFGGDLFSMYTLNGEVLPGHTIANNTVRVAQRNWLNTTLQADNSIWKAAQYHRPIVPHYSSKGEGSDEFYDWANLFYEYGVRLVMESDAHVVKMTEEVRPHPSYTGVPHTSPGGSSSNWFTTTGIAQNKGITFIGEGTWGTIRTPDDSHPMTTAMASFYGFNWVLVDACKIEIRSVDTQNPNAVPEHAPGDYTSISSQLDAQFWKPTAIPNGLRTISRCYPPVADFTANQTNIFTGTTVNFTDLSTNTPTSWSWDFGDGNTSTQQNPSNQYNTAGTYTVTLTATNADGTDSETKTAYIVVSDPVPPTADFIADITSASVGQVITFTDLTAGVPTAWSWNFGDGNTSTSQNPTHSYAAPGTYTVTLTATNAYGNDTEVKTAYITVLSGGSVSVTIASGTDDAEEFRVGGIAGDMYLTSSDLEIGNDGGDEQYVGLRFRNLNVPQGATISNAKIRFRADESDGSGSQLNIYIRAQDVDDAATFTTGNYNISNRTLTTAEYHWPDGSVPGWSAGNIYDTPDLSTVIQEVVDRAGWTSGNDMVFVLWSDLGESSERVADSYEGGYPAELIFDYTVPAPPAPVASFTAASTSVCEGTTVALTDQSTNTPTSWNWSVTGPATFNSTLQNPSFNFTTPGTYSVQLDVTNAGGADTYTMNNYITVNAAPNVSASGTATICEGQSTALSASGASTYAWSNGGGTGANPTVSPTTTTTYTVTGTDGNGCTNTDQVTITVNAAPTVAATGTATICAGQSTSLSASGASTYAWNNGGGTGANPTVSPATTTTYTVTGTAANGCTDTDQVTVTVNALPNVVATGTATICEGESTSLSASGASSYSWNNGGGTGANPSVSPSTTTTYTVTGTGGNGCTNTDQVTVTVNAAPTVNATGTTSICAGQSTSISASGASTYAWNNGGGTGANPTVSPASTTTYTVTGTAANGCTDTDQVTVTVNALPNVVATGTATICEGQSTALSATGASTYAWNNGGGTGANPTVSPTTSTTYTVTGTDGNGCTNTDQVSVTVNPLPSTPTISNGGSLTFCDGGSVLLTSSEISGNTWSTSATTDVISVTTSGSYTVTYTDGNGCAATSAPTVVTVNPNPAISMMSAVDPISCASTTGSIQVGGSGTGDIAWTGTASGSQNNVTLPYTINNLAAGSYNITLTDANGCTSNTILQALTDPNAPTAPTITPTGALTFCDGGSVLLTSSQTGGNSWSTSETSSSITVTSSGAYSVTYTDGNGCSATSTPITVTVNTLPTVIASGTATICEGESTGLNASGADTYAWDNGAGTGANPTVAPTTTTTYTVTGTDANGCTNQDQVMVTVNAQPTIAISGTSTICEGESTALTASGASTYDWDNNLGAGATQTVSPTTTTTYTVTGTDAYGCTNQEQISVTVNALPTVAMEPFTSEVCLQDNAFSLSQGTPSGGSYTGTGVSANMFDPATAGEGTHQITYTYADANGCENTASTDIQVINCASLEDLSVIGYKIYPNPASDVVKIERTEGDEATINVYDAKGRLVLNTTSTDNPITIDVSEWTPGEYIFRFRIADNYYQQKIVVR